MKDQSEVIVDADAKKAALAEYTGEELFSELKDRHNRRIRKSIWDSKEKIASLILKKVEDEAIDASLLKLVELFNAMG